MKPKQRMEEWRLDPKRFSSWSRLIRVLARVRRVLFNMRSPRREKNGVELDLEELREAEEELIAAAQGQAFAADHKVLKSGKPVDAKSQVESQDR